jgi:hypothetical protein
MPNLDRRAKAEVAQAHDTGRISLDKIVKPFGPLAHSYTLGVSFTSPLAT